MKVEWIEAAKDNAKQIFEYWNNRNKSKKYSRKLFRQFKEAANILKKFPLAGRETTLQNNIRVLISGNYEIFYQIGSESLIILMIWDGRRNSELNPFKK